MMPEYVSELAEVFFFISTMKQLRTAEVKKVSGRFKVMLTHLHVKWNTCGK